jgi:hypothetical protein
MSVLTPLKRFYDFVAKQPCLRCGRYGVQIAHIESIISPKTGLPMQRSHKTLAAWGCLPLCSWCHNDAPDAIGKVGEEAFFLAMGKSASWRFQYVASLLAQFASERK